jgi:CheY-like chemotaxis protein
MVGNPLADRQSLLNDLRVLVVDDEPDARELIAQVLTGCGAEVVAVESASEALAEMERQRFDVLVSDIGMPLMDGYALIEKVRQLPEERGGRIPAAALTAYAGVEDRVRVLSAGYQFHIPKPVEPAELTTVVAKLAERYTASPIL